LPVGVQPDQLSTAEIREILQRSPSTTISASVTFLVEAIRPDKVVDARQMGRLATCALTVGWNFTGQKYGQR
jgi:hypothetical protein